MGSIRIDVDREIEFAEIRLLSPDQFGLVFSDGDGDTLEFVVYTKDLLNVAGELKKAYDTLVSWIDQHR